jgi:hypothetical protein
MSKNSPEKLDLAAGFRALQEADRERETLASLQQVYAETIPRGQKAAEAAVAEAYHEANEGEAETSEASEE